MSDEFLKQGENMSCDDFRSKISLINSTTDIHIISISNVKYLFELHYIPM